MVSETGLDADARLAVYDVPEIWLPWTDILVCLGQLQQTETSALRGKSNCLMRILQRYVLMQLLRVFLMLLSGLTLLLVFVGVAAQASKNGLGPMQVMQILPFIVPSLLPFTIPATLLLTVCVVYGRMAGDNEITATKAAGIHVAAVLWPSLTLGAILSLGTLVLTDQFIPWAATNIESIITGALEDIFIDQLRTKGQFNDIDHGMSIAVSGVDGKRLLDPTIRYTPPGGSAITIQSREATIKFDMTKQVVRLNLFKAEIKSAGAAMLKLENDEWEFPLPIPVEDPKARNIPIRELQKELAEIDRAREDLENQQLCAVVFALTQGNFERLAQPEFKDLAPHLRDKNYLYCKRKTEIHSRIAMACSCFCFVLFGSPFSILQGKRQFLTNFFLCFLPILICYYPVMLLMMNLGKTNFVNPAWGMWVGNGLLLIAAAIVLRKVSQH